MNQTAGIHRHVHRLLPFLLFTGFALCVLAVLYSGARSYRSLTLRDQDSYHRRTCVQYLSTKVRQASGAHAVALTQFGDGDALAITEDIGGQCYTTLVYCSGGWLRELFTAQPADCTPQSGEPILELQTLSAKAEEGLIILDIIDLQGRTTQITLAPRGGKGNLP